MFWVGFFFWFLILITCQEYSPLFFNVALISALFTVLRMTTIDMREIEDEAELGHRAKYAELVMKVRPHFVFGADL